MTTEIILISGGAVLLLLVILCAAYDCFFYKPACLASVPSTPKPQMPHLLPRPYTRPAVKGTIAAMDTSGSGSVTVDLRLTDGQLVHLTTFDSDDAVYNWLCADELTEAINDSIKQQNTQDTNQ